MLPGVSGNPIPQRDLSLFAIYAIYSRPISRLPGSGARRGPPARSEEVIVPPYLLPDHPIQTAEDYAKIGGWTGLERALNMTPQAVIDEIKKSGLRGRGGAGFPTGIKWA